MASSPRIIFWCLLVMFLFACGGIIPAPSVSATQPPSFTQSVSATEIPIIVNTPQPAIPERRLLALEYPPRIRAGDSDIIRLTLEVDESGDLTPTAVMDGNVITGEVIEIPNLYATHNVVVEARFDVAGMEVAPPGLSSQTLFPGQTVQFLWSIRPAEVGIYRGTVWLSLRFVDKVSGVESQRTVSAQTVEIEAVNLYGVPARVVRFVGGIGSVVGAVVGFPFFEDIVKFLFKRKRNKRR